MVSLVLVVGWSRDDDLVVDGRGGGRMSGGSVVPVWRSVLAFGLVRHQCVRVVQSSQYVQVFDGSSVQCRHASTL